MRARRRSSPPKTPEEGYHFTEDMTNKAIKWVRQQKALMPDKPFFMYFAPGACHAPHHVPKEWIDKYKGKFDQGWDKLREEIFARQKELGVIPPDCGAHRAARGNSRLGRDAEGAEADPCPANGDLCGVPGAHRPSHWAAGRRARRICEVLDDTLVYYIIGDNGASAEGTLNGSFNEMGMLNGMSGVETVELLKSKIDDFGGPERLQPLCGRLGARAWTPPTNGPSKSHRIGAARATARSCTGRRASKPRERSALSSAHVIDVAPTILEAAGLPHPTIVNSVQQAPMEGVSMLYAFDDAKAADRHETQYFEMFCNRGIYHKGWTAVTRHSTPWDVTKPLPAFDDDVWELYDTNKDWSPGAEHRERKSAKTARTAEALADRGGQVQRSPA